MPTTTREVAGLTKVSVLLPNPQHIAVPPLPGALIILDPGTGDDAPIYYGRVTRINQRYRLVDVTFDDGETATVPVETSMVSVLEEAEPAEADPQVAFRMWLNDRHEETAAHEAKVK